MFRFRIALLVVGVLMGGWLCGQDKNPPARVKGTLPAHWKDLGLTDQQKQLVYRTRASYREKINALDAMIKELKKAEKAELEKILTPAQKDRLKELLTGETKEKPKEKVKEKSK